MRLTILMLMTFLLAGMVVWLEKVEDKVDRIAIHCGQMHARIDTLEVFYEEEPSAD